MTIEISGNKHGGTLRWKGVVVGSDRIFSSFKTNKAPVSVSTLEDTIAKFLNKGSLSLILTDFSYKFDVAGATKGSKIDGA